MGVGCAGLSAGPVPGRALVTALLRAGVVLRAPSVPAAIAPLPLAVAAPLSSTSALTNGAKESEQPRYGGGATEAGRGLLGGIAIAACESGCASLIKCWAGLGWTGLESTPRLPTPEDGVRVCLGDVDLSLERSTLGA